VRVELPQADGSASRPLLYPDARCALLASLISTWVAGNGCMCAARGACATSSGRACGDSISGGEDRGQQSACALRAERRLYTVCACPRPTDGGVSCMDGGMLRRHKARHQRRSAWCMCIGYAATVSRARSRPTRGDHACMPHAVLLVHEA